MGQTWEGESNSISMGRTCQNCRTWKYESHWAKRVTFGQMGQTWEGESHSITRGHTYQNCRTWK